MTKKDSSMRNIIANVIASILLICATSSFAGESNLSPEARAEIEKSNPLFGPMLPDSGLEAVSNFQAAMGQLDKTGSFDGKMGQLIRLAASAGMKCEYCILAHTAFAKKAGATDEEIREVIMMTAGVQLNSTLLYGNSFDFEKFQGMFK
jgi:AhpD family alkylhydroperoxidase